MGKITTERFYTFKNGEPKTIFKSWNECVEYRAKHHKGAFRVFNSLVEAQMFLGILGGARPSYDEIIAKDDIKSAHVYISGENVICDFSFIDSPVIPVLMSRDNIYSLIALADTKGIAVSFDVSFVQKILKRPKDEKHIDQDKSQYVEAGKSEDTTIEQIGSEQQSPETNAPAGNKGKAIVYSDGSFNKETNQWGYGVVMFPEGNEQEIYRFAKRGNKYNEFWQIAGEVFAVIRGIQEAINLGFDKAEIHYDYAGIEKWATGEWAAKNSLTEGYASKVQELMASFPISFVKEAAHTGVKYNEEADKLAKQAAGV